MKLFLILLFVIGFVGISLFGFSTMADIGGYNRCLAAIASGEAAACMNANGPIGTVSIHFGAFQKFSSAIFNKGFLIPLLLLITVLLVVTAGLIKNKERIFNSSIVVFYLRQRNDFSNLFSRIKLNRWLAIHENSPSSV